MMEQKYFKQADSAYLPNREKIKQKVLSDIKNLDNYEPLQAGLVFDPESKLWMYIKNGEYTYKDLQYIRNLPGVTEAEAKLGDKSRLEVTVLEKIQAEKKMDLDQELIVRRNHQGPIAQVFDKVQTIVTKSRESKNPSEISSLTTDFTVGLQAISESNSFVTKQEVIDFLNNMVKKHG